MEMKERQKGLREFVESEVYVCQSRLVKALFTNNVFFMEDVINLYRRFDGALLSPNVCFRCTQAATCLDSETGVCAVCFVQDRPMQLVSEWWVVSEWLETKLLLLGEPILSNAYGSWWGRCTSGEELVFDFVLQDVYGELLRS